MYEERANLDADFLRKVGPVLRNMGFANEREALKEQALLLILSKINRYRAECSYYEKKYGMTFEKFAAMVHENSGEDFEHEDDLLDWRFAKETLEDLMRQKKEIEDA
ncbi:Uncharacterized [Moorella glycerini]|uniref:Uncharacterized protein n=2 Tax=Neomoorella TaxID=44260 RepID=A0A9X7J0J5_9FIRM|nr:MULTISPECIES: hypothetical protein [Moorella]KYH33564.1 hypothetical protein MOMUL_02700 [Moorella mulderi DSM 14980]PRR69967.1 hypothetical protein MOST_28440 [Moorella stamsii]CEP68482.1 Uncharacterized [Moorella glycerini]